MTKVRGESVDKAEVSRLLGCDSNQDNPRRWSLLAPDKEEADLDVQVAWILARVTSDLGVWKKLIAKYRVDIFCGLYFERPNRGVGLSSKSMADLGARGIELEFDIYTSQEMPNPAEPTSPSRGSDDYNVRQER